MNQWPTSLATIVLVTFGVSTARGIDGNALAVKNDNGSDVGTSWVLPDIGYVGTYIDVASPGDVTISVNASGVKSGGINPEMNIVVADELASFNVTSGSNPYEHTFSLPAGKYFVRTEFANDPGKTARQLTIEDMDVSGATFDNFNSNSNALDAANDYIANYRKGNAELSLFGAMPGAEVQVKLVNHEFHFGANFPGSGGTTYFNNSQFTNFIANNFNALVPSNGGKWSVNESFDQNINLSYADSIRTFAENNDMDFRMHALAWGTQNPGFIQTLLDNAEGGSQSAKNELRTQISERVDYYVGDGDGNPNDGDRAARYFALDVLNEHFHQDAYFNIFTPAELADIFNEVKQAVDAAGSPDTGLFLNEYNVVQNGIDDWGNWYREGADQIIDAGGTVDGLGVQYYARATSTQPHSAALINQILQNLSIGGFDLTLTEYGVQGCCATETQAADILEDSMRMFFGTPQADGFFHWGFWEGGTDQNLQGAGILVDQNFNLTESGERREDLMAEWDTDLTLNVDPNGNIDFTGFYGQYEITLGGETYALDLAKGIEEYSLIVDIPPDFNDDDMVDGTDLGIWESAYGVNANGDADGDGDSDGADFLIWQQWSGFGVGSLAANVARVPEPATVTLLAMGMLLIRRRRLVF